MMNNRKEGVFVADVFQHFSCHFGGLGSPEDFCNKVHQSLKSAYHGTHDLQRLAATADSRKLTAKKIRAPEFAGGFARGC